ncbi:hypothetical protein [Flavobacterium branchiicola]|uniref:MFS transporter n=1 Tax=Flavobacterium branchiicola TaxID=1114875 RepID=A0ABV9PA66_9FLAO|nr:hypothetical protein [Flavobacterium branchiicola]MBS7252356.1 hypothetical protein [Flavobacterium branchiicola]
MNSERYKWTIRFLILTPLLLLATMIIAGGGHGFIQPVFALFPFATFQCIWSKDLSFINFIIGVVQFPIYGLCIDKSSNKIKTWIIILILHILLAGLIFVFASENWK